MECTILAAVMGNVTPLIRFMEPRACGATSEPDLYSWHRTYDTLISSPPVEYPRAGRVLKIVERFLLQL